MSRIIVAVVSIVGLLTLAAPATEPVQLALEPKLHHPPADAIDRALLEEAAYESVRNGIATLLARQEADTHDLNMILPPINRRTVVDYRMVDVRYSWKMIDVPVYRDIYEDALVPKRDDYGMVIGYEKKKVLKRREKVGMTKERRLVRDPEGDVVKKQRSPIFDTTGPDLLPRGLLGLNGMALYVLTKAQLNDRTEAHDHAEALSRLVDQVGLPDHTWDLAWLIVGYANWPTDEYNPLLERLAGKLIDGQIRDGANAGMWGPVSIHHDLLAKFLTLRIRAAEALIEVEERITQRVGEGGDVEDAPAAMQRLHDQTKRVLRQVVDAMNDVSPQGGLLMAVTKRHKPTENYTVAPLPYYIYNRQAADIDSTAVAVFALAELDANGRLPKTTHRSEPGGRPLMPPEQTARALQLAMRKLAEIQKAHGGFDEANAWQVLRAYDRFRELGLQDVPYRGKPPELPSMETLRSNIRGVAAMMRLSNIAPGADRYDDKVDLAVQRGRAVIDEWLERPLRRAKEDRLYLEEEDAFDDLMKAKGVIETETEPTADLTAMPTGYFQGEYELLPAASVIHARPNREGDAAADDPTKPALDSQSTRLMYRLVITQRTDGQWPDNGYGPSLSSMIYHARKEAYAESVVDLVSRGLPRQGWHWIENRYRAHSRIARDEDSMLPNDMYATLNALVYLVNHVDRAIVIDDSVVVMPEQELIVALDLAEREERNKRKPDDKKEDMEAETVVTPDLAAKAGVRHNPARDALIQTVRDKVIPKPEPEPEPEPEAEAEAAAGQEQPAKEQEPLKTVDDLFDGLE